jgi:hypothetical protein
MRQLVNHRMVGRHVLFFYDGRVAEVSPQTRAVDLQLLFIGVALGEQSQIVARRQILQCLGHATDHFHGAIQNALRKRHDRAQIVVAYVPFGEMLAASRSTRSLTSAAKATA